MIHLKNYHDTEDIFQTVFLKYVLSSVVFENAEHEKAWFIRVTLNACKDLLKSFFHSHTVPLEEWTGQMEDQVPEHSEVLAAVLSLPVKYRNVVYLHYYEDYSAAEIGRILGKNVNTVYTLLTRSKRLLREKLGGERFWVTDDWKKHLTMSMQMMKSKGAPENFLPERPEAMGGERCSHTGGWQRPWHACCLWRWDGEVISFISYRYLRLVWT